MNMCFVAGVTGKLLFHWAVLCINFQIHWEKNSSLAIKTSTGSDSHPLAFHWPQKPLRPGLTWNILLVPENVGCPGYIQTSIELAVATGLSWWCCHDVCLFLFLKWWTRPGEFPHSQVVSPVDTTVVVLNHSFCLFTLLFRAESRAYGGSQARGQIGAIAPGLHHSHSNARSEPPLRPMPQLTATPDPSPTEQGQGLIPQP